MRAAVLEAPERLVVRDVPVPGIAADELMVEVAACGICGSDLRYLAGENPWALHTTGENTPNPPNMILGHEFAGTVVEAGSTPLNDWVGARVVVAPFDTCGVCRACRTSNEHLCPNTVHTGHGAGWGDMEFYPGAMARYCRAWARRCYRLPDDFSFEIAALLDIAGVSYRALERADFRSGGAVAVVGMGPLGVIAVRLALLRGATHVFAIDIYDGPLRFVDADRVTAINSTDRSDWPAAAMDATSGWGVDAVIDTIGTAETLSAGRRALAPGGTLVMLAVHGESAAFAPTELAMEKRMTSSANYAFSDFQSTLDLAFSGALELGDLVTHRVSLADVNRGVDILRRKDETGALKVVVIPGDEADAGA